MAEVILHPKHPGYCKECIFHGKNSECLSKDYIEHSYEVACVWGYCKFKKVKKRGAAYECSNEIPRQQMETGRLDY